MKTMVQSFMRNYLNGYRFKPMLLALLIFPGLLSAQSWIPIWSENFDGKTYESAYATGADSYWANATNPPSGPRNSIINGSWEVANTHLGATQTTSDAAGGRFLMYWTDNSYNAGAAVPAAAQVVLRKSFSNVTIGKKYRISYRYGGLAQGALQSPGSIGLNINGNPVIDPVTVTASWVNTSFIWTASSNSMLLEWIDTGKAVTGNDFGLDDLKVDMEDMLLPVIFSSFTVRLQDADILLHWQTSEAFNCRYYEIQRAADGAHFTSIGTMAATAMSATATNYEFTDGQPLHAVNYYRLAAVDNDGRITYSSMLLINHTLQHASITVTPNPVADKIYIHEGTYKLQAVQLFTAEGRAVKQFAGMPATGQIDMSTFPSGMYVLSMTDATGTVTTRQLVKK